MTKQEAIQELRQRIKDCGQELIDRAESMVPDDTDVLIKGFSINIYDLLEYDYRINYSIDVFPKSTYERYCSK